MTDTTKKILILAAVFAAIFLIAKRQGKGDCKSKPLDPGFDFYDRVSTHDEYGMPIARPSWDYDFPSDWQN